MRAARYVAVEGTDGVGKTTLCNNLSERLRELGIAVERVREPGGTDLGEKIRQLLLHGGDMADWTEALLFAAQRSELVDKVVRPALDEGRWVLSDRSVYSSLAYQGHARGLEIEKVRAINTHALGGTLPDLVVWLETDHRVALSRQEEMDRIGSGDVFLQSRVREGYRRLWETGGERIMRIKTPGTPGQNVDRVVAVLEERGWLGAC